MLKHDYFTFDACDVTTVANTHATIPAGRHLVVELNTGTGGVSVRPAGSAIDISSAEWLRIQQEGKVRK
jgi:hypothetical protein